MQMHVRQATPQEYPQLWQLFHDTVHQVNRQDYTSQQLAAWAPDEIDMASWVTRMEGIQPFVVDEDGQILGFSDIQRDGLVDMFFVDHRWQRKGIGSRLFAEIHDRAKQMKLQELHSHVSITARPFFAAHGFDVINPQEVIINGIALKNYLMRKQLMGCL